jgi:hypothetical protein
MPLIAQDALEAGLNGPAKLRLAILERPTYFEVAEVVPRVVNELGLAQITIGEAALRVAKETAREILRNGDDPLRHVQAFESLWVRSAPCDGDARAVAADRDSPSLRVTWDVWLYRTGTPKTGDWNPKQIDLLAH